MDRKILSSLCFALVLTVLGWGGAGQAMAQADFYKGKTVDCIIPYKTGGGYDNWVRSVSLFFTKYAGATLVAKNMPGAGGLVGTNRLYTADPNGLTIGILNASGLVQAVLTDVSGVKFDMLKFTWLGRLTTEQKIICVGSKSPYKTIEAMRNSTRPVKFGAPGIGSSMFMEAALAAEVMGIKIDLVTGYDTSEEVDLAVIRGELDAASGSFSSKIDTVKNGDMVLVAQFGNVKEADLAKTPNLADLPGLSSENKQLLDVLVALGETGRPMAGPPGMPPERTRFLQETLKKIVQDPEFLQITKKQQMDVLYMSPEDLYKMVDKGINLPPNLKTRFREVLAKYQPKK